MMLRKSLFAAIGILALSTPGSAQPTFSRDIAPILQRACQDCHRPGSIGPMSLLTYQEARPWARAIREQVVQRNMPPWHIDRTVGIHRFKNDPSLAAAEIEAISKWVDAGAPQGDPAHMPPPRQFADADRWHIGQPDIVVKLKREVVVKAKAPDRWVDLEMEDLGLKTDRYIRAVEVKPTKGIPVVHHAVSYVHTPDGQGGEERGLLEEYAVGKFGDIFPEGTGRLLKVGTRVIVNAHLHAIGTDTPADISVGIKLYPEGYVPKRILIMAHVGDNEDLDIPANTKDVRSDGYTMLLRPARITAFQPHLHNRGQAQCLELIYPPAQSGGRAANQTVSCVDKFRFNWHIVYHYAEESQPIVPAGTVIHVTSWFDNTSGNKFNPDPSNPVAFGQRTIDEMSFAWLSYYYLSDDEYRDMLSERQRQPATVAGSR
jgi:hypothetical protein